MRIHSHTDCIPATIFPLSCSTFLTGLSLDTAGHTHELAKSAESELDSEHNELEKALNAMESDYVSNYVGLNSNRRRSKSCDLDLEMILLESFSRNKSTRTNQEAAMAAETESNTSVNGACVAHARTHA